MRDFSDTSKPVNKHKNIEQAKFNNSFAEFEYKSLIKSYIARNKH